MAASMSVKVRSGSFPKRKNVTKHTRQMGRGKICRLQMYEFVRLKKEGKMKAVVSITIDEEFVIHDIKIIEGEKGMFIAMPSRKTA